MSEAKRTPSNSGLSGPLLEKSTVSRGLKALSLIFKDRNLRSAVKVLLSHLATLNESSPRQFAANIAAWGERLSLVQSYYRYPETTADEAVVECYPGLNQRIADEIAGFQQQPKFTILIPAGAGGLSKLEKTLRSARQQFYANLELCIVAGPDSIDQTAVLSAKIFGVDGPVKITSGENKDYNLARTLDRAVQECRGDLIGFLSAGDRLARNALFEVVRLINHHPNADIIYSDEERKAGDYYARTFHKPDWSPDLFLSLDYLRNFLCCRTEAMRAAGALRGTAEDDIKYDLLLRMIGRTQRIYHIPLVLYHEQVVKESSPPLLSVRSAKLQRNALQDYLERSQTDGTIGEGSFPGSYRLRRKLLDDPRVSIIVPTKDKVDLLARCLESIESTTSYRNYEIIVVDNGSAEPGTLRYLKRLPHKVIRYPGPFNFSKLNNLAAREAGGSHLLFLNNDTEVIAPEWLQAMVEHSQRPEVGAVGAKLLYPNGTIQHAGIGLMPSHIALHLHRFRGPDEHGYRGLADVVRNLNAVTGACLMTKATLFNEVGGFDETLPLTYNDIDLCLKMRAQGLLIVYTPFALLYHHEGISVNVDETIEIEVTEERYARRYLIAVPKGQAEQVKAFYTRWRGFIENDGYYVAEELT
jgi:GT2 family glycosyltransferase